MLYVYGSAQPVNVGRSVGTFNAAPACIGLPGSGDIEAVIVRSHCRLFLPFKSVNHREVTPARALPSKHTRAAAGPVNGFSSRDKLFSAALVDAGAEGQPTMPGAGGLASLRFW
jgi:hypothetical protein